MDAKTKGRLAGAGAAVVVVAGVAVWLLTREPEPPEGPTATPEAVAQERKRLMAEMPGTYQEPGAGSNRDFIPAAILQEEDRLMKEMPGTYKMNPKRVDIEAAIRSHQGQAEADAKKSQPPPGK